MAPEMWCCDIACNAALTRCPSHRGVQIRFLSARAHEDSECCSRSGDDGAVTSAAHFSLCVSFVHFPGVFSFSPQPRCFLVPIVFSHAAAGLRLISELRLTICFTSPLHSFPPRISLSVFSVHVFLRPQPRCFLVLIVLSVQLSVCDSFLDYGYFSLSFVKERNLIPAHWRE